MQLTEDLKKILNVGIALTSEKNYYRLFERILATSMELTNSDAGTIYVREPESLRFMIMKNKSMKVSQGGEGDNVSLPNVPLNEENICAYSALRRQVVNISDVYSSAQFDFKGPKNYDKMTGYQTKSMLVIPLEDHEGENLGVIQLINAMDADGKVIAYEKKYEYILYSLASQTAVTLANMNLIEEMKKLLYAVVSAFTTAIDERTPYNANHTKNVAKYCGEFADELNRRAGEELLSENQKEQLVMAAMLHDIGKLIIPLEVMDKATRLGGKLDRILRRFELYRAWYKIDYLEGRLSREDWEREDEFLKEMDKLVTKIDTAPFLEEEWIEKVQILRSKKYTDAEGTQHVYLMEEEAEDLQIRKGTLTAKERKIIESHVVMTSRILDQIHFGKMYENVPVLAGKHHEFLDGSGYPCHLTAEELPLEARMLGIIDIYDSLISTDRPYKSPMPKEKAFSVLDAMVREGKLDGKLVKLWCEYQREGTK